MLCSLQSQLEGPKTFHCSFGGSGMEVELTSWICSGSKVHFRKQIGILTYSSLDLDLDSQSLLKQNDVRGGRLRKISQKKFQKNIWKGPGS